MAFVGRVSELASLADELRRARAGEPRVVVIEGEAGIGKSTLLGRFAADLEPAHVLRAGADEAEQLLPYGLLTQLAGDLLPEGAVPSGSLAAGAALVGTLGAAQGAEGRPVVVLVEDLHWADQESADAVLFALRRLRADRVLFVITLRPGGLARLGDGWSRFVAGDDRVTTVGLGGFGPGDLEELAVSMGVPGLGREAAESLLEHTAGNPLYCRALFEELTPDDLRRAHRRGVRAPRALAGVIAAKISVLSSDARALAESLSVLGLRSSLTTVAALTEVADVTLAVEEAQAAGLLRERMSALGREVAFVHPLTRRAVYDDLPPTRRSHLHQRASDVLGGTAALDHRVAAAAGTDDRLAAELEESAGTAATEGRWAQSATWLAQAAALSADVRDRERRLLDAFEASLAPGEVGPATPFESVVLTLDRGARAAGLLGHLAVLRGDAAAEQLLQHAWATHDPAIEPLVGAAAAADLALLTLIACRASDGLVWADRAVAAAQDLSIDFAGVGIVMGAVALSLLGRASEAQTRLAIIPDSAEDLPDQASDALVMRGVVRMWSGELRAAQADLNLAAARRLAGVPLRFLGQSLGYLGEAEFRFGAWDDAVVHTELAVSLAHSADRELDYPFVHGYAALVPASRGEWEVAQHHVTISRGIAEQTRVAGHAAVATLAGVLLAAARNDPAGVVDATVLVRSVGQIEASGRPGIYDWRPWEVEALIGLGRLDEAERRLDEFAGVIPDGLRSADVALARLHGALASARGDHDAAAAHFADAWKAADRLELPFDVGHLALTDGRRLRRAGDVGSAVPVLQRARQTFAPLRARPYVEACERELELCGVARDVRRDEGDYGLTPTELVVARLVATGRSNRETAEELYVTVKTVEFHLRGVFAKLGISSRQQIAARLEGHTTAAPTVGAPSKT
ncbi:AAA family ATPase [Nocardioides sp. MH1]|uniref:helix-turn-helix transcriptional regulator n=1 Tax=Nocardioides sp. MH1 TaxID=3242490 RepID=UPI003520F7A6